MEFLSPPTYDTNTPLCFYNPFGYITHLGKLL